MQNETVCISLIIKHPQAGLIVQVDPDAAASEAGFGITSAQLAIPAHRSSLVDVTFNTSTGLSTGLGIRTASACITVDGIATVATANLEAHVQDLLIRLDQDEVNFGFVSERFGHSMAVALQSRVGVPLLIKAQVQSASIPNLFTLSSDAFMLSPYQQVQRQCLPATQL